MPEAHRIRSARSSFSISGDNVVSNELSIERVKELRKDYLTRRKEVSSMLFSTDLHNAKASSPKPSSVASMHNTRSRQQSQSSLSAPPLTPPRKKTAFSAHNSMVGPPSVQEEKDTEKAVTENSSLSNFWDSIVKSPLVISSSIATTMDLSSLWGGESGNRDLGEKKTSLDALEEDLIGYKDDDDNDENRSDDDLSTIATDDVYTYLPSKDSPNTDTDQDSGKRSGHYNNSIANTLPTIVDDENGNFFNSYNIVPHSYRADTSSKNLNGFQNQNLKLCLDDRIILEVENENALSPQKINCNGSVPRNNGNVMVLDGCENDVLFRNLDYCNNPHNITSSSSSCLYKNTNSEIYTNNDNYNDVNNIDNINSKYNDNNYNDNNYNNNNNGDYSNRNSESKHSFHPLYENHDTEIEQKNCTNEIDEFERLRKWRDLELEADQSFIEGLKQTKKDLKEKLELLGEIES